MGNVNRNENGGVQLEQFALETEKPVKKVYLALARKRSEDLPNVRFS
ncbi:hypothetical protein [Novibacillus thermophilus]|nr:hypothetical protein [Novibacillus thermophilus]